MVFCLPCGEWEFSLVVRGPHPYWSTCLGCLALPSDLSFLPVRILRGSSDGLSISYSHSHEGPGLYSQFCPSSSTCGNLGIEIVNGEGGGGWEGIMVEQWANPLPASTGIPYGC